MVESSFRLAVFAIAAFHIVGLTKVTLSHVILLLNTDSILYSLLRTSKYDFGVLSYDDVVC